jgi:hypothetical protein
VTKWVAEHFGYRALVHLAGLFDTVVAETRAAAGMTNVDLSLIANMAEPPSVPLLPASMLDTGLDFESMVTAGTLLGSGGVIVMDDQTCIVDALWNITRFYEHESCGKCTPCREGTYWMSEVLERIEHGRGRTNDILQAADRPRIADVTGVERVIRRALTADDRLGQRRPQEMASLLATLDGTLDSARRLRLARDSWAARADLLRRYRTAVEEPLSIMRVSRDSLDQIRRLAGPSAVRLVRLTARSARAAQLTAALTVPAEGTAANDFLKNAIQLASRAAELRQRAVIAGDMKLAWEAASAASGAIVLFERASEELQALAKAPAIPKT